MRSDKHTFCVELDVSLLSLERREVLLFSYGYRPHDQVCSSFLEPIRVRTVIEKHLFDTENRLVVDMFAGDDRTVFAL